MIDNFIANFKKYNVLLFVDIRSSPLSDYFSEYNKDALGIYLKMHRIYLIMLMSLEPDKLTENNTERVIPDFETFSMSEPFLNGVKIYVIAGNKTIKISIKVYFSQKTL